MINILSYPLTLIFYTIFLLVLIIFQPLQWLMIKIGGYQAHKKTVDYLNFCIISCMRILGTSFKVTEEEKLPVNTPIIFVSNHQSMYDISPKIWFLRDYHPKFVSKKELGKGIPSISFNLKYGGSVLIDRKNPKEAEENLNAFGKYINDNKRSAVIYPEGTRSLTGKLKPFKKKGLNAIIEHAPDALIVPVTVNNTYKITGKGNLPLGLGSRVSIHIHKPIDRKESIDELITELVSIVDSKLLK